MSLIEWTGETWNPVVGCTRVSEGCRNCYAEHEHNRRHKSFGEGKHQKTPQYAEPFSVIQPMPARLARPRSRKVPTVWFVNSESDLFHEDLDESFIRQVFAVMADCPRHIFQVLTKRSRRLATLAPSLPWPENVWMGVSVEDSRVVDRIDHLRRVPAHVRWLSCEPLIGPLDDLPLDGIDWVVVGGESNPGSYGTPGSGRRVVTTMRPTEAAWVRSIRGRCEAAGVAFFFKQWGDYSNNPDEKIERAYWRETKAADPTAHEPKGGAFLDGQRHLDYPIDLEVWRSEGMPVKRKRVEIQPSPEDAVKLGFDYSTITDSDRRQKIQTATNVIRLAYFDGVKSIVAIGEALIEVKNLIVDHGQWISWLEAEFHMSVRTAQNYMAVARRLADPENASLAFLPAEALYLLAPPKVPETAVEAVRSRLDEGERLGVEQVREVIATHRPVPVDPVPFEVAEVTKLTRLVRKAVFDTRAVDFAAGFRQLSPEERKEAISTIEMLLEMVRDADKTPSKSQ